MTAAGYLREKSLPRIDLEGNFGDGDIPNRLSSILSNKMEYLLVFLMATFDLPASSFLEMTSTTDIDDTACNLRILC